MKIRIHLAVFLPGLAIVGIILGNSLVRPPQVRADDDSSEGKQKSEIQIGLSIAPAPLNLKGKNKALVGLGSYIVNAQADCNGCHSAGPATEYAPGGNPYFGQQPDKTNLTTYLGGGRNFGALIPGSAEIISRNLTPDKSGRPVGGLTFNQFLKIIRTGVDMDGLHPTCAGAPTAGCIPRPFDGSLLQVMPWPVYKNMTDHDLRAIYEYLSAVPCIAGPAAPSKLHNDC